MINFNDVKSCESYISSNHESFDDLEFKICTDSRTFKRGQIFLAISGEKFNPLKFIDDLIDKGCETIIYTESELNNNLVNPYEEKLNLICIRDSISFLQEISKKLSIKFQENGGILIAISGSNGKTTTKEMLYHLFHSVNEETICTQKNNNNHIGVPLTLLQITKKTKFAIIELGSNHPGEIPVLCDIVQPTYGYTTNIGDTHMEFFETRENVFKEEGYLCGAVGNTSFRNKYFFVNADDELLARYLDFEYAVSLGINGSDFKFIIEKEKVIVQNKGNEFNIINNYITGKHNFFNLCAAFSITKVLDPSNSDKYLEAVKTFKPTPNRSQWLKINNNDIFLDAYNANPSSMLLAVEGFMDKVGKESSYCLILGDMNELGKNAESYHTDTARKICELGVKNLIFVGKYSNSYNAGCINKQLVFQNTDELKKCFQNQILNNYKYVFIKGSRSLQLESLLDIK